MCRRYAVVIVLSAVLILAASVFLLVYFNPFAEKVYTSEDFGINTVHSAVDFNGNGTDDYTDLLLGAKADAENRPQYDPVYYDSGYPPDNIGVCADVIWRAFKAAGYSLRDMVDNDIINRPEAYPKVVKRDNNIDFRRVRNLRIFFDKYAVSLNTDIEQIAEWQAGDIVIFGDDKHIGIVSDKRNRDGQPYIIHNGGQKKREEDYLRNADITGHYRFDASLIDAKNLIEWAG